MTTVGAGCPKKKEGEVWIGYRMANRGATRRRGIERRARGDPPEGNCGANWARRALLRRCPLPASCLVVCRSLSEMPANDRCVVIRRRQTERTTNELCPLSGIRALSLAVSSQQCLQANARRPVRDMRRFSGYSPLLETAREPPGPALRHVRQLPQPSSCGCGSRLNRSTYLGTLRDVRLALYNLWR
jgi:hypothetical protein